MLQNIKQYKLLVSGRDEQMLIIEFNVTDDSIVLVDLVAADVSPYDIDHSDLCLSRNDDIVLDKLHSNNLLTVDVQREEFFFILKA